MRANDLHLAQAPKMVHRGLTKHCKRSRWFELACLVEQAEFELRCGLKAALHPTVASQSVSARPLTESRRLNRAR